MITSGSWRVVTVEVCTAWTAPDAPRDIDAPATADVPDPRAWLAGLDSFGSAGRLGLHGRTLTQLVAGEPVEVVEEAGDWVRVAAPWQPSAGGSRGYLAWVRRQHLTPRAEPAAAPTGSIESDRAAICWAARRHLGLRYLWGVRRRTGWTARDWSIRPTETRGSSCHATRTTNGKPRPR